MKKIFLLLFLIFPIFSIDAFNKNGTWPYMLIDQDKVRDELCQLFQSSGRINYTRNQRDEIISKTIADFVKTYNEYVTVFAYGTNYGTVVHHHPGCDITQEIIDILKNKFKCTQCKLHCQNH